MLRKFVTAEPEIKATRERIFTAAARLFSEKGYHGASMREISEHSGVSKPAIYYHFGSKEGIYSALVNAGIEIGIKQIRAILNRDITVKQKLIEITKARFRQVNQYPEMIKFFLSLFHTTENLPFLEHFRNMATERRRILTDLIQEAVNKGEFGASTHPELASEIYSAIVSHFLWNRLNTSENILSDLLAEQIIELLFKGLNE